MLDGASDADTSIIADKIEPVNPSPNQTLAYEDNAVDRFASVGSVRDLVAANPASPAVVRARDYRDSILISQVLSTD